MTRPKTGRPRTHAKASAPGDDVLSLPALPELPELPSIEALLADLLALADDDDAAIAGLLADHAVAAREINALLDAMPPLVVAPPSDAAGGARRRGRPRKTPDATQLRQVEAMAELGLTVTHVCRVLGLSTRTYRRYRSAFDAAFTRGRVRTGVRSKLVLRELALSGDLDALIWLQKTQGVHVEHFAATVGAAFPVAPVSPVMIFLPSNGREVHGDDG